MDANRINTAICNNPQTGRVILANDLRDLADEIEAGVRVVTQLCTSDTATLRHTESMLLIKTARKL